MSGAAIFDFDGTLVDGYSGAHLLRDQLSRGKLSPAQTLRVLTAGASYALGSSAGADMVRSGLGIFAGRTEEEMRSLGMLFARRALGGHLLLRVEEVIARHRKAGRVIIIASSALPFQVEALAEALGADHVLTTRCEVADGRLTGRVDGEVLWGPAKADAARKLCAELGLELQESHAYSNGVEDEPLLALVGHPHALNPDAGLEALAAKRGWPVERLLPPPGANVVTAARTVAAYGGIVAAGSIGAGLGLLNRSRRTAANTSLALGTELALGLAGVSLRVSGEKNLWSTRPAVFVYNHQSQLDPVVVFHLLGDGVMATGKKEVARQPIVGQFAWIVDAVLIDRDGDGRSALAPVIDGLRAGRSVAIAPEGTRSLTGMPGPFKKGAFHLAAQANVPIVPIVLRNTRDLQWRGALTIRPGIVDVLVLPPIAPTEFQDGRLNESVEQLRGRYVRAIGDWEEAVRQGV